MKATIEDLRYARDLWRVKLAEAFEGNSYIVQLAFLGGRYAVLVFRDNELIRISDTFDSWRQGVEEYSISCSAARERDALVGQDSLPPLRPLSGKV